MDFLPIVAAICVTLAVFLAVTSVGRSGSDSYDRMAARLARQRGGGGSNTLPEEGRTTTTTTTSTALRREGQLDQRLSGVRIIGGWRNDLERAGLSWRTKDLLLVVIVFGLLFGAIAHTLLGTFLISLVALGLGGFLPIMYVKRRIKARAAKLNTQVVDTIDLVASSLKSGFGFMQAIDLAAREQPEPMSAELLRMTREIGLGIGIDEGLERLVERTGDPDLELVINAVLIHRRVGGNLAEVLGNITQTIRERIRVRGEIKTLTAQARMSSWIIGLLPIGLGIVMSMMQPGYMSVLWTDGTGQMLIAAAVTLEIIGFYLVRKIGAIDY